MCHVLPLSQGPVNTLREQKPLPPRMQFAQTMNDDIRGMFPVSNSRRSSGASPSYASAHCTTSLPVHQQKSKSSRHRSASTTSAST